MRRALVAATVLLALFGCKTRNADEAFFEKVAAQSKEEIMAQGDALAEKKHWEEARRYYSFLADSFPNDPLGRQAALKVADTFFRNRDPESLTEAQVRYRDFANRFPSDPNRAYALLMLGKTSFQQRRGPLRDLKPLHEAEESFRQVIDLYPDSEHAAEARSLLEETREDLARHEFEIGRYYLRIDALAGARARFEYLLSKYPDTKAARDAAPLLEQVERRLGSTTDPGGTTETSPPSGR